MQKEIEVRDESLFPERPDYLFDANAWPRRIGDAQEGRGGTVLVADARGAFALRHYRRGGLVARLLEDRYWFRGAENTRSLREWHLLQDMVALGLPVPAPAAARFTREGFFYRADILTRLIPDSDTLAQRLTRRPLVPELWHRLGEVSARFHQAGICHADVNAHNVLLDSGSRRHHNDY